MKFENDASALYLRSRFTSPDYDNIVASLDEFIAYRKESFRLRARGVYGSGSLIELTFLAAGSEPGDERVLGLMVRSLEEAYKSHNITFVVTLRYKDVDEKSNSTLRT